MLPVWFENVPPRGSHSKIANYPQDIVSLILSLTFFHGLSCSPLFVPSGTWVHTPNGTSVGSSSVLVPRVTVERR